MRVRSTNICKIKRILQPLGFSIDRVYTFPYIGIILAPIIVVRFVRDEYKIKR